MPVKELICLANSYKRGGRCVAGLATDGSGWLRAVSPTPDGTLQMDDLLLDDGTEPALLDVIQVGFQAPRPALHQPENHVIDGQPWRLRARPLPPNCRNVLRQAIQTNGPILGDHKDRVPHVTFQAKPAPASLALIASVRTELYRRRGPNGKWQARGHFRLANDLRVYDFPLTDPLWVPRIVASDDLVEVEESGQRVLLTISLSEPWEGQCYKLVAAVVDWPHQQANST
jgi:hypothetical protein